MKTLYSENESWSCREKGGIEEAASWTIWCDPDRVSTRAAIAVSMF